MPYLFSYEDVKEKEKTEKKRKRKRERKREKKKKREREREREKEREKEKERGGLSVHTNIFFAYTYIRRDRIDRHIYIYIQ